jgi:hypothetical protein
MRGRLEVPRCLRFSSGVTRAAAIIRRGLDFFIRRSSDARPSRDRRGAPPISPASEKMRRRKPKRTSSSDRAHLAWVWRLRDEAERTTGRHPSVEGGVRSQKGFRSPARCRENSETVHLEHRPPPGCARAARCDRGRWARAWPDTASKPRSRHCARNAARTRSPSHRRARAARSRLRAAHKGRTR